MAKIVWVIQNSLTEMRQGLSIEHYLYITVNPPPLHMENIVY